MSSLSCWVFSSSLSVSSSNRGSRRRLSITSFDIRYTVYDLRNTICDVSELVFLFFFVGFQEFSVWCLVVVVVVVVWCGINDWKFRDSMYVYIEIDVCTSIVLTWLWINEITLDTRHYRDGMDYNEYFEKIPKYQLRRTTWVMRVPAVRPCTFLSSQSVCYWSVWTVVSARLTQD